MSSQTPPQSLDDEEFVLISEDHHESLSDFPNFQPWVSRQGDMMTSSSNINPSLSTCLEGVQQQVKMTHQRAYEQNLLLNNISTFSCQLNPGQSDVTPEMKDLLLKLEECERSKGEVMSEASVLRHQVEQLREENEKLSSAAQYPHLHSFRRDVGEQFNRLGEDLKRLTEENKQLARQLQESEVKRRQQNNTDVPNNSELLAAQMKALKNMEQNQLMKKELEQLRQTNVDSKSKLEFYKFELENSKSALVPLHKTIQTLKTNEEIAKNKTKALKELNDKMEIELKNLRKVEEDSKQREEKQIADVNQLKTELEKIEQTLIDYRKEKEQADKKVEEIGNTNLSVNLKLQNLVGKARKLPTGNQLLEGDFQSSEQMHPLDILEKLFDNFTEAFELLDLHSQQFLGEKCIDDQDSREENPMKKLVQEFIEETEKRRQMIETSDKRERDALQLKISNLTAENRNFPLEIEEIKRDYAEKIQSLESAKSQISEQNKNLSSCLENFENQLKELSNEKLKMSAKFEKDRKDFEAEISLLKKRIETLKLTKTEIESKLKTVMNQSAVDKQELNHWRKEIDEFKTKELLAREESENFAKQKQESEEELKLLRQNAKELKNKEENLKSVIQQLQKQLKNSEEAKNEETKILQIELESKEAENFQVKEKLKILEGKDPSYEQLALFAQESHCALKQKDFQIGQFAEEKEYFKAQLDQLRTSSVYDIKKLRSEQAEILKKEAELRNSAEDNARALQNENRELKLKLVKFNQIKLEEDERALGRLSFEQTWPKRPGDQTSSTSGYRNSFSNKEEVISSLEKKLQEANNQKELFRIQAEDFEKDFHDERERVNILMSNFEDEKDNLEMRIAQLVADSEDLMIANRELKFTISQLDSEKIELENNNFGGALLQKPKLAGSFRARSLLAGSQSDMNQPSTSQARGPNIGYRLVGARAPENAAVENLGDGASQQISENSE